MLRPLTLYGIRYSPWTERARWALDHHGLSYRYVEHVPLVGEVSLRLRARGAAGEGPRTVPLLVEHDGRRTGDSWEIVARADEIGSGRPLRARERAVAAWHARLEPCFAAVRRRVTRRTLRDREALEEAAAGVFPRAVAGLVRPVAVTGARYLAHKHGFDPDAPEDDAPLLEEALEAVRAALGDGAYLDGGFSGADVLAATLLQGVRPVDDAYVRLGPATRRAWAHAELAERFADLLAWRDALYARHRHPR